jgi:hypothetical protein
MTKQSMHSTAAWESQRVLVTTPTGFDISQLPQQDSRLASLTAPFEDLFH